MARKELTGPVFIGIITVIVLIVGYFLWTHSSTPEPTIPPDQTLKNPLGNASPKGPPAGASGQTPAAPAPGTVDPQRGFGPSKNAPIPR